LQRLKAQIQKVETKQIAFFDRALTSAFELLQEVSAFCDVVVKYHDIDCLFDVP